MDTASIIGDLKERGTQVIEKLKSELLSVRTGKPNPGLIEEIVVNAYGGTTKLRLKELASITTEPPQSLLVTPFDPSVLSDIETAIISSQLNITPSTQGTSIRVSFPPLTQDQRTLMVKVVSTTIEEFKEQIRMMRDDARKKIKALLDQKAISEDDKFKAFENADKTTKELSDQIEVIKSKKVDDLMTV